jgi:hypothetical protein
MDLFGVHMNFLWFIQVIALSFILKIHFLFNSLDFLILWTERIKSENTRGLGAINPKAQTTVTWTASLLYKNRGAHVQFWSAKGYGVSTAVGLKTWAADYIGYYKTHTFSLKRRIRYPRSTTYDLLSLSHSRTIWDQWLGFGHAKGYAGF